MYELVYAPAALTLQGEWGEPGTVMQDDYDSLSCEYCRLKIVVCVEPRTGVKRFVHAPGNIENVKRLKACRYHPAVEVLPVRSPPVRRQVLCKTVSRRWHCCWYHVCWPGEKVCPCCDNGIYAIDV
ncbi:hypothetical protein ACE60T_005766 [Salmonella enterica]